MPKVKVNLPPMPRLPKEPDPKMLRTFGPRPTFATLTPPDPSGPAPSPSAYRRANPDNPPPPDYRAPSMLAEHKRLAILFAGVCVAFAWYCWKTSHKPSAPTGSPVAQAAAPAAPSERAAQAPAASSAATPATAPKVSSQNSVPRTAQPEQPIYVQTLPDQ